MNERILIVGHGLAGAVLAQTLIHAGLEIKILEPHFPHHASKVAAGLINPFIGPKLNPPENIIDCLRTNQVFFSPFNKLFGKCIYQAIELHRVFRDKEQSRTWEIQGTKWESLMLSRKLLTSEYFANLNLHAPFGGGLTRAFKLDFESFLSASKQILKDSDSWESRAYCENDYKCFTKIIFCEGFRGKHNSWFKSLPFSPAQGEVLKMGQCCSIPLSNGTWLLPDGNSKNSAGSTWKHDDLESGPTEEGKREILNNLSFLKDPPCEIISHNSGVRSSTIDRMPMIGKHPQNSKVFIFNGFGSRGATTIPYYAEKMTKYLTKQKTLPLEADIKRFYDNQKIRIA